MLLIINGEKRQYPNSLTGQQLYRELNIRPATVVVELNGTIVPRDSFLEHQLADGDVLEIVTIVGGG